MPIRSGELARLCGVSSDSLRHYERIGVLPPPARSASNYRVYSDDSVDRVLLVRRALSFGFSLAELATVLKDRDKGGRPCRKVRAITEEKLNQTEIRLQELSRLRDDLRSLLEDWDNRLASTSPDQQARLLDALSPASHSLNQGHLHATTESHALSAHRLSGHWSHESAQKRTPAARRQKR